MTNFFMSVQNNVSLCMTVSSKDGLVYGKLVGGVVPVGIVAKMLAPPYPDGFKVSHLKS